MKSSESAYDDLTAIRGIGPARQQWLRDALGVRTYADLAALSVDQVESQLKADGQIPSRSAIQEWLTQARELAATTTSPAGPATGQPRSPVQEDGWKPFASFVVEFQVREAGGDVRERRTAVHHMEEDRGTSWPGIAQRELCQWMIDQIREQAELEIEASEPKEVEPAPVPAAASEPTRIQIRQLRVRQPPQNGAPGDVVGAGQPSQAVVKGREPFVFEVDFELTGPAAVDVAREQVKCRAQSYAYNQAGGSIVDLGDTDLHALQPEELDYSFTLPEATLSPGTYRLWVEVKPESAALLLPDYVEIPNFRVDQPVLQ